MILLQDVYLSEAFSTAKKPWSISLATGIEHLLHIFMIGMSYIGIEYVAQINAFIFVTGVMIFVLGLFLVLTLPETRNMTLRQARDAFLKFSIQFST